MAKKAVFVKAEDHARLYETAQLWQSYALRLQNEGKSYRLIDVIEVPNVQALKTVVLMAEKKGHVVADVKHNQTEFFESYLVLLSKEVKEKKPPKLPAKFRGFAIGSRKGGK